MSGSGLGEFEQLVLLAILQLEDQASAAGIRRQLEHSAGRRVSRGALYATLDRLETKGFLGWAVQPGSPGGGVPPRRFQVTRRGIAALRRSWGALHRLGQGLERLLDPA